MRCEEVTDSLLKKINLKFPIKKRKVYFDESLGDAFEIECFSSSDIDGVCDLLTKIFKELLAYEMK